MTQTVNTPAPSGTRLDDRGLPVSVFAALERKIYQYEYRVQLHVGRLVGGTPTDQNVAEGWIRTKMGVPSEAQIADEVKKVMEARPQLSADSAMDEIARNRNLSGFKRDFTTPIARVVQEQACTVGVNILNRSNDLEYRLFSHEEAVRTFGELFIEGRQVKAMLKEATNIAMAAGRVPARKWGATNKGIQAFLVEHMFVVEDKIYLGVTDPDFVNQSFVHTWRGSGIKLEEVLDEAVVDFTLRCDYDFEGDCPDFWAHVFVTGQENGLGASRSQGFGRFSVTRFEQVPLARPVRGAARTSAKLSAADEAAANMAVDEA